MSRLHNHDEDAGGGDKGDRARRKQGNDSVEREEGRSKGE